MGSSGLYFEGILYIMYKHLEPETPDKYNVQKQNYLG